MRLFIALDPGDEFRRRLVDVLAPVRAMSSAVRWVGEAQLHVTLAFLGDVSDESQIANIARSVRDIAGRHSTFAAHISDGGAFPDWHRPRVVWLGFRDADRMLSLGSDTGRACAEIGYPPDHPFRAHLTIGRVHHPLPASERDGLRAALASVRDPHPFEVTRVVLMRSQPSPTGSRYTEVATHDLRGA